MRSSLKFSRLSRRVLPGLNALKTSLEIISKAGSSVPPLQAVVDTALEIIEYAEVSMLHPQGDTLTQAKLASVSVRLRRRIGKRLSSSSILLEKSSKLSSTWPLPRRMARWMGSTRNTCLLSTSELSDVRFVTLHPRRLTITTLQRTGHDLSADAGADTLWRCSPTYVQ